MSILHPGPPLVWATASRAVPGQVDCGDAAAVHPFPGGLLLAVADGLGHGSEAANASHRAMAILAEDPGAPVVQLMARCHERLKGTRGVVMTLASLTTATGSLTWAGVGNVEAVIRRAATSGHTAMRESVLLRGGVVGSQMPPLRPATTQLRAGDALLFATDGIARDFAAVYDATLPPQLAADALMARCARSIDDALVLIAQYEGHGRG